MRSGADDDVRAGAGALAAVLAAIVVLLAAGTAVLRPFADGSVDHSSQLLRALIGAVVALALGALIAFALGALISVAVVRPAHTAPTSPGLRPAATRRLGMGALTGGLAGATLALVVFTTVAVGATAGIATVEIHPNVYRPAPSTPVEQATPPTPPAARPERDELPASSLRFPDWLTAILAVVATIVAAFGLMFGIRSIRIPTVRLLGTLFHGHAAPTTVEETMAIDLDGAAASFEESAAAIEDDSDPRRAIIAAYARLLDRLDEAGCTRRPAEAPEEHLRRSLGELDVPKASLELVVAKFLVARFSRHDVTEADRDDVRTALREAGVALRRSADQRLVPT